MNSSTTAFAVRRQLPRHLPQPRQRRPRRDQPQLAVLEPRHHPAVVADLHRGEKVRRDHQPPAALDLPVGGSRPPAPLPPPAAPDRPSSSANTASTPSARCRLPAQKRPPPPGPSAGCPAAAPARPRSPRPAPSSTLPPACRTRPRRPCLSPSRNPLHDVLYTIPLINSPSSHIKSIPTDSIPIPYRFQHVTFPSNSNGLTPSPSSTPARSASAGFPTSPPRSPSISRPA